MFDTEMDMKKSHYIGLGIALGAGIGAALASATHMGAWLPIMAGIGLAIGASIGERRAVCPPLEAKQRSSSIKG